MIGTRTPFGARGPRVLISIPNEGWVRKELVHAIYQMTTCSPYVQGDVVTPTLRPLENVQHHLVQDILSGDYAFWLSIDADNPPRRNVLGCAAFDLDVVGFPTPVWHWVGNGDRPIYWNVYKRTAKGFIEWPDKTGLQRVDAIGGGCFLIARRVLEHPAMKAPFHRGYDAEGRVLRGNDISFSVAAAAAGFSLHAHYDYPCGHITELDLTHVISAYNEVNHG